MSRPFFSIIIPSYNSAKTLSSCLDSILNQSYHDFEIVVIDGCSTDETIDLIKKYPAFAGAVIRLFSEKDKGIYDAMNKGIQLAKGDWLYFLGSDDKFISENILFEINKSVKTSNTVDVIYGNVFDVRTNCIKGGEFSKEKLYNKNICHQAIFFNKIVFQKIGNYDLKYKISGDWDHNVRWFESEKIEKKYVNIVCAVYADGGYSSKYTDSFHSDLRWRNFLNDRSKLTIGYKYLVVKFEILKSINELDYKKLLYIIFRIPTFFLK